MASMERDPGSNLSLREKNLVKRRINQEHNSNFRAGYIHINEDYLQRTGVRGRKSYCLCCIVAGLLVIALANLAVTGLLIGILRLSYMGIESFEFLPSQNLLRVFSSIEITSMVINNGRLGGRAEHDLVIISKNSEIKLQVPSEAYPQFSINNDRISMQTDNFIIKHPDSGKIIFSTEELILPRKLRNLHVDGVIASKEWDRTSVGAFFVQVSVTVVHNWPERIISTGDFPDLVLESYDRTTVSGDKGVLLQTDGEVYTVANRGGIIFNATENLTLNGKRGIYLPRFNHFPMAAPSNDSNLITYKVCVCLPSGKLFLVPVKSAGHGCARANEKQNPCEL